MSDPSATLALPADAQSVGRARAWVREIFMRLDRPDLADSAELGVSELVTNAVLHADPPITVRVRGTREHPRVEVQDGSRRPPAMGFDSTDDDQLLSTFGRGLGMVAMQSVSWGADLLPAGKIVWFVPADQPRLEGDLSGELFDFDESTTDSGTDCSARVRILDLPVARWVHFRQRYFDLARELRILGLAQGDRYAVARRFSKVFREASRQGGLIRGREPLDSLTAGTVADHTSVSLDLLVPDTLADVTSRLLGTLEEVDDLCRREQMLTLAPTEADQLLSRWWFGEFVRQPAGRPPTSWPDFLAAGGSQTRSPMPRTGTRPRR